MLVNKKYFGGTICFIFMSEIIFDKIRKKLLLVKCIVKIHWQAILGYNFFFQIERNGLKWAKIKKYIKEKYIISLFKGIKIHR